MQHNSLQAYDILVRQLRDILEIAVKKQKISLLDVYTSTEVRDAGL